MDKGERRMLATHVFRSKPIEGMFCSFHFLRLRDMTSIRSGLCLEDDDD